MGTHDFGSTRAVPDFRCIPTLTSTNLSTLRKRGDYV